VARRELLIFGQVVRRYRLALGISQEILAERSDLHRTYISGIERGQRNVSLINIHKLAKALNVSPAELFGRN
jgi:transcriptional regulator with XRE-family HTH domain